MMFMKNLISLSFILLVIILLCGCISEGEEEYKQPDYDKIELYYELSDNILKNGTKIDINISLINHCNWSIKFDRFPAINISIFNETNQIQYSSSKTILDATLTLKSKENRTITDWLQIVILRRNIDKEPFEGNEFYFYIEINFDEFVIKSNKINMLVY
jgi:hypothetical protein